MPVAQMTVSPGRSASLAVRAAASWWAAPALGVALVALGVAGAAAQLGDAMRATVAIILAQGAVYIGAVALTLRGARLSLGWLLGVAALLRLTLLFLPPYLSNDIYRYVWDGRVQGAGINPYLYIPNDPALAALRDAEIWPNVNRSDYAPTIYPPVAQMLFFLIARIAANVTAMKLAWVAFEAAAAYAIVRWLDLKKLPRERLVIYAWSPLAAWEIAGSGHLDAAMIAFVALAALASAQGRDGLAGGWLGAATLVKFFPLVIFPALWRGRGWRAPAALAATVVAGYLVYASAGTKVLGFLSGYSDEEGLRNGAGFWLVQLAQRLTGAAIPPVFYIAFVALILAAVALYLCLTQSADREAGGALALASIGMVGLSPSHPWYFLWLAPLLCVNPSAPLLWLIAASPVLYWPNPYDVPWNRDILYGGVMALALAEAWRAQIRWRREPSCP